MDEVKEEERYEQELDYTQLLLRQTNRICVIMSSVSRWTRQDVRGLNNAMTALESLLAPYWDDEYKSLRKNIEDSLKLPIEFYKVRGFHILMVKFQALTRLMNDHGLLLHEVEEVSEK